MAERQTNNHRSGERSSLGDHQSVHDWMAARNAQVAQRDRADTAGRQVWAQAIRTGQPINAAQPSDLRALGIQALGKPPASTGAHHGYDPDEPRDDHGRWTTGGAADHPDAKEAPSLLYGLLTAPEPSPQELAELRRRQAAQAASDREQDAQHWWLAIAALAPFLAVGGIEGAVAAEAARTATAPDAKGPLDLVERVSPKPNGDTHWTRIGRRAHEAFKQKVDAKDGWDPDPELKRPGKRLLRPDAGTPQRNPDKEEERYYLELKPDTPRGRDRAAQAVKRYQALSGQKVRAVFYDPKKFK